MTGTQVLKGIWFSGKTETKIKKLAGIMHIKGLTSK